MTNFFSEMTHRLEKTASNNLNHSTCMVQDMFLFTCTDFQIKQKKNACIVESATMHFAVRSAAMTAWTQISLKYVYLLIMK